jgi:hypothetical protein
MSSTPVFVNGQQASASAFMAALEAIQALGSGVLQNLTTAQTDTLVEFNKRLEAINARRTRTARIVAPEQSVKFVVSDFTDIDQVDTVATIRANSSMVTLKEKAVPAEATVQSIIFTANKGSIESLNSAQSIMRVSTFDGSIPTGTFSITLAKALTLNQFIIDIVPSPSTPTITVSVSSDGVTYTSATQVIINSYVVNVLLPSTLVKYVQIQITPAMPDDLNGDSYTFGVTDFSAQATEYYLRSDFLSKIIQFYANSEFVIFNAPTDSNILYYLSIWEDGTQQTPFIEINPGDAVQVGTSVNSTVTTTTGTSNFLAELPASLYPNTLQVSENGNAKTVAFGLMPEDNNLSNMQHEYVTVIPDFIGYSLQLLSSNGNYNAPRTFTISYVSGEPLGWALVATTT